MLTKDDDYSTNDIALTVAFWANEANACVDTFMSARSEHDDDFKTPTADGKTKLSVALYLSEFFRYIVSQYEVKNAPSLLRKSAHTAAWINCDTRTIAALSRSVSVILGLDKDRAQWSVAELDEKVHASAQSEAPSAELADEYEMHDDDDLFRYVMRPTVFEQCLAREVARPQGGRKVLESYGGICHPKCIKKSDAALIKSLSALRKSSPNFSFVVDDLMRYFLAQKATDTAAGFKPILLVGPPGIGKTHFVNHLAGIIGVESKFINLSGARDGLKIKGNSPAWSQSQPGCIARFMADAGHFNPVIVLDEIDKCGNTMLGVSSGGSLDEILLPLLERETSINFEDDYFGVSGIDLSGVSWIATCNSIDAMSAPMLSRLDVYHIAPPTPAQQNVIIGNLHRDSKRDNKFDCLHDKVPDDVSRALIATGVSMRELSRQIYKAQCNAVVRRGGKHNTKLTVDDIRLQQERASVSPSIGFTADHIWTN